VSSSGSDDAHIEPDGLRAEPDEELIMRIAMLGHGTRGDFQPLIAIGDELRQRGHSVVLTVNEDLAPWVARSGLEVVAMQPSTGDFLRSDVGTDLLANGRLAAFAKALAAEERRANRSMVSACLEAAQDADLVLSTILTSLRGICLSDALQVPHAMATFYPSSPTREWTSILSPWRDLHSGGLNRQTHALLTKVWWGQHQANIDEMCDMLGAPRYPQRPGWEHLPTIGCYSPTVVPRPADWTDHHHVVGWAPLSAGLRERLGEGTISPALDAWLEAGPPPVYFGFGSMPIREPAPVLAEIADITQRRGLRALIGAGWTDYASSGDLPGHLHVAADFDHDRVLPRCVAAVHHGGSGTTGAALRAGLPSVVCPVFADQPVWAHQVTRAGAGVTVPFKRFSGQRIGRALDQALAPERVDAARAIGVAVRAEDGTRRATDLVEELARLPRAIRA
jgi:sterol 3beta-glucosyltransferase